MRLIAASKAVLEQLSVCGLSCITNHREQIGDLLHRPRILASRGYGIADSLERMRVQRPSAKQALQEARRHALSAATDSVLVG
jgi:hypothetical protein